MARVSARYLEMLVLAVVVAGAVGFGVWMGSVGAGIWMFVVLLIAETWTE